VDLGSIRAVNHPVLQRLEAVHVRILLEKDDVGARNDRSLAAVGVDQAGEALEQGRLACPVAADKRQPVALADVEVEVLEQPALALD
jgi:hypothetical protein